MNEIINFLNSQELNTIDESYYTAIQEWLSWYSMTESDFHKIDFYNGMAVVQKKIAQLGMAKTVCEDWASLLMNERVTLTVENEAMNEKIAGVLHDNSFYKNMNRLVELYMAMGTGAMVEYKTGENIRIEFIRADMIFPVSWNSAGITECAFGTYGHDSSGDYINIQIHLKNERGNYEVHNHRLLMDESGNSFKPAELPKGVQEISEGTAVPLFQIVMPNVVNNYDLDSPLGIAVFANAIDVLKEIDLTFDNFRIELETGRRMVFLARELFFSDENGNMHNVITENETVLRFVGQAENENSLIHDYTPDLRISQLKEALQFQLDLLSEKCGMGTNRYEFTAGGAKTATEVISEDSDLYQSLKKHELVLESGLRGLIKAIASLQGTILEDKEITVTFDDSIIRDADKEQQIAFQEVASGLLDPVQYRMKIYGESEAEALQKLNADENGDIEENSPLKDLNNAD